MILDACYYKPTFIRMLFPVAHLTEGHSSWSILKKTKHKVHILKKHPRPQQENNSSSKMKTNTVTKFKGTSYNSNI